MNKDWLTEISRRKTIIIYGAGKIASDLANALEMGNISFDCFVVSDKNRISKEHLKNTFEFAEWYTKYSDLTEKYSVLVAVSPQYYSEITARLNEVSLEYYLVSETDIQELVRQFKKVEPETFLTSRDPLSNMFGFDRGQPIDRWYIDSFIADKTSCLNEVNRTIEVAESTYSERYFPKARHDILDYGGGQDLTDVKTLNGNVYDIFIATQVFNFIYDVKAAIEGAHYLLKPGGVLVATVAGNISQISRYDMTRWGDYWRFTELSIRKMMQEVFGTDVWVYPFGNASAATAYIQGLAVEDLPDKSILNITDPDYSICIGIIARKEV